MTEEIIYSSVIDAVNAGFKQGRCYSDHWNFYMSPEQREALLLAYFEGLSQREIAARTGEALGTVKTRCRLALEKLSRLLAEVEP